MAPRGGSRGLITEDRVTVGSRLIPRDLLACLIILLLCVGFFWPVLAGHVLLPADALFATDQALAPYRPSGIPDHVNTLMTDTVSEMYVWRVFTARSMSVDQIPLWNPFAGCGQPLLANDQSAVLSPTNFVLNLLLPPPVGHTVYCLITLIGSALFCYGLVRALGGTVLGGLLGGMTYAFGGFILIWLGMPHSATALWLPAMLWATHRVAKRPTAERSALLAAVVAWQFLSGHLSTSVQMLAFWCVFALFELVLVSRRHPPARVAGVAGMLMLAVAVGTIAASPQLLPLRECVGQSRIESQGRSRWATESAADAFRKGLLGDAWFMRAIAPRAVLLLVLPEWAGNPAFGDYRPIPGYGNYAEQARYVGVAALVALISGVFWRPRARYAGFFLVSGWVVLGAVLHLPICNLITYTPVLRMANPQRMSFIFALCSAVCLGLSVPHWLGQNARSDRVRTRSLPVFSLVLFILCAALSLVAGRHLLLRDAGSVGEIDLLRCAKLVGPALFAGALSVVFLLQARLRSRPVLGIALTAIVLCDLFLFAAAWHPPARASHVLPLVPPIRKLGGLAGHWRVSGPPDVLQPELSVGYGILDARAYTPIAVDRFLRLVEALHGKEPGTMPWLAQGSPTPSPAFNRVASVRYWLNATGSGGVEISELPQPLPHAYLVGRDGPSAPSVESVLREWRPGTSRLRQEPPPDIERKRSFLGPAQILTYAPHRIVMEAVVDTPAWLVLTDTYYPGWRAEVNGVETEIVPASYAFRGIAVPAGKSRVELRYEPSSYRVGLFMGLVGILVMVGLAAARLGGLLGRRPDASSDVPGVGSPARTQGMLS